MENVVARTSSQLFDGAHADIDTAVHMIDMTITMIRIFIVFLHYGDIISWY